MTAIEQQVRTAIEQQVRQDQEAYDAAQAAAASEDDADSGGDTGDEPDAPPDGAGGQTAIIDRSQYEREDLQIQKVDGQSVDKIRVKLTGSVMLNRSDPADVALYNRLALGKELELRVAGKVSGTGTGWTTNREGDLDAIVGERTLKVDTVWVLEPEDLTD